ncbi:programmed cell death protein 1-like [Eleutherodactylus coqui]|uniref:programmed cell death protein 1-like n=1 Tax=Eleutherodactylus coqui TaxID=57060 RepID=UPI0034625C0C
MRMKQLCLIMHIICVSIVPRYAAAKNLFVHSPPSLHLKPGENATFTCNISALNYNPADINWYINKNTSEKIADLKGSKDPRLNISISWTLREAKLRIINVTFTDSGKYHCSHVNINASGDIIRSNISELFVNDVPRTVTNVTDKYSPESNSNSEETLIISTSLILALLLLLAIGAVVFLFCYKRRNNIPQQEQQDLEKPPQDSSVYSVDYGILEFGDNQPYRKSPELSVSEQVEYATITFPQQTAIMGEKRRKLA